jgi:hypothetical protein
MSRSRFHVVILFLSLSPLATISAQPKPSKPPLELSVDIVSEKYCAVTSDSAALEMKLKLRYRNVGSQKLILYKGHDLFYQTRIRSAPGNATGPYEVWIVNSRYFDEEVEPIDQTSPSRVFLSLSPGSVYQREIMIGMGVVNDKVERGDSSINAGDHTLQITVSTWYKSRSLAQKLRQEWQGRGLLWAEPLISTSIHFVAQRPRLLVACKSSN